MAVSQIIAGFFYLSTIHTLDQIIFCGLFFVVGKLPVCCKRVAESLPSTPKRPVAQTPPPPTIQLSQLEMDPDITKCPLGDEMASS